MFLKNNHSIIYLQLIRFNIVKFLTLMLTLLKEKLITINISLKNTQENHTMKLHQCIKVLLLRAS